ncbi:16374_t:CDS:2 [Cetraspora pellucida]|uniref:16374_t:CDS:1 n=1 Tax=Cetraspora pellucida TaxID=1433469 RepID=A0ACA9L2J6_9GLOM|nr:16374_t:CDS:2 [Cetraspora pellucida]
MSHLSQLKEHESTSRRDFSDLIKNNEHLANLIFYMHNIYEQIFNGKVGAPVHEKLQNGCKVLEVCCDDGIWITEVATEYPNTKFYAVDFTLPNFSNNIDNIIFIECDISKLLPFPDNEFDYISIKDKFMFINDDAFRKALSEILRVLKPEGWLEVICSYGTDAVHGSEYTRLDSAWKSWLRVQNVDLNIRANLENYLQETGKVESMSHRIVETPFINDHAFGEFMMEISLLFYRHIRNDLAPFINLSFEEFDNLVKNAVSELNDKDLKVTLKHKQVLARKKSTNSNEN